MSMATQMMGKAHYVLWNNPQGGHVPSHRETANGICKNYSSGQQCPPLVVAYVEPSYHVECSS
jgi:hypothetical protein